MITLIIIWGFVAIGLIVGLTTVTTAPVGYQDENGFHYGADQGQRRETFRLWSSPTETGVTQHEDSISSGLVSSTSLK